MRVLSVLLTVLLWAFPFTSRFTLRADDASKNAKVEVFFKAAKMDETLRHSLELIQQQMKSGFLQQLMGTKVPAESQKKIEDFQSKINQIMFDAMSWDKLKPGYVKLYSETYTEEQIDDMLKFYQSPTGKVMVDNTPALMNKSTALVQDQLKTVSTQIQQLMQDFLKQQQ